jgi:hypothetical protein
MLNELGFEVVSMLDNAVASNESVSSLDSHISHKFTTVFDGDK